MADNVAITAGSGTTIAADEVTDGTLGTVKVQYVKIMDGTLDGTTKAAVGASGLKVDLGADNDVVVTNAGTFAVQVDGSALTALQLIDDAIYADDADWTDSTSKHMLIGGLYQSTPQTVTDGDVAPLQIDSNGNLIVAGTVTANLSATDNTVLDNIDTSTSGAATSLAIIDDWDETDRCKVNIVAGQAGITAGAGAVGASTPRVTLASDDPGVALLTTIDADTGSMATLLGTIDTDTSTLAGAVSGSEMQVDVVAALPTGSNTIGAVTNTHLTNALIGEYETVAASQTGQVLGATGGTGDFLSHLLVIPATTSPGNVIILDNATSITVFAGGASSVTNLVPFAIPLNMVSASGAWSVTTGANVSVIAVGNFT